MSLCGINYFFVGTHTQAQQADSLAQYMPDDCTFEAKYEEGTNLRKILKVFANQLISFDQYLNKFTNEMSPECANDLLKEWERMLGIPDDCFDTSGTLEERRRNLLIKFAKMNVQTVDDFEALGAAFGLVVTVTPGYDYEQLNPGTFVDDTEARFGIVIEFVSDNSFPYTFPFTFGSLIQGLLECVFNKVKPANCIIKYFEV